MSSILIIDAEGTLGELLKAVLSRTGHDVTATADAEAGVRAYKAARPDLVLLDRELPEAGGLAVLRALKEAAPPANVVVLNRRVDPEGEVKFRRAGARVFLSKAVGIETLLKVVERSLSGAFAPGARAANSPELLIIDDDPSVRRVLKEFLERKGYGVTVTEEGTAALRLLRRDWPGLILLDVNMPKMNGVKVLKEIRRINTQVPVLMITGQEDLDTARECLRLGAFDYMLKPLNLEYLETSVWGKLLSLA